MGKYLFKYLLFKGDRMRKVFTILIIVGISILIGLCVLLVSRSSKMTYKNIIDASKLDYEVDLSYSWNDERADNVSFHGFYTASENKILYYDDNHFEFFATNNLYQSFGEFLENKKYEPNKEYRQEVSINRILLLDPFYGKVIQDASSNYECVYEFFEHKILTIHCANTVSQLHIDFDFE